MSSGADSEPAGPAADVRIAEPRKRVQARMPDGRIYDAPAGTPLVRVLRAACEESSPAMAAVVNGRPRSLAHELTLDSDVVPVTLADADGIGIYRRSLSFLLLTAVSELFPVAEVFVEHSATTAGAYFCEIRGRGPFSKAELAAIERRMREIVQADAPFRESVVPVAAAAELFLSRGEEDKARLFAHRQTDPVTLVTLRNRCDWAPGLMAPSAGCLQHFALHEFPPGFMLQFPHQSRPTQMTAIVPYPKLFRVFAESGRWLDRLGIRNAGALNDSIEAGRLPEISLVAEALHESRIAQIAQEVASRRLSIRVVLIAGPSSSGKTTFSKRLAVQLLTLGLRPFALSLDDYFLEHDRTPRDEKGEHDFECIQALDLGLFKCQLQSLIDGCVVQLPRYVFATGQRQPGATVKLESDNIVIVEGIHGLNPDLVSGLPSDAIYRIYVSALTQLNLDRHNRLNTTDCRLIRRIVRDAATRGYNATGTLARWPSVVAGEKKWIFPFQENCDAIFNSALVHEIAVLRPLADPLLMQVQPDSAQRIEANRLLSLLEWFRPARADTVPSNSILREFVGGSILETFRTWEQFSRQQAAGSRQ
jgi:uridine kinase